MAVFNPWRTWLDRYEDLAVSLRKSCDCDHLSGDEDHRSLRTLWTCTSDRTAGSVAVVSQTVIGQRH